MGFGKWAYIEALRDAGDSGDMEGGFPLGDYIGKADNVDLD